MKMAFLLPIPSNSSRNAVMYLFFGLVPSIPMYSRLSPMRPVQGVCSDRL